MAYRMSRLFIIALIIAFLFSISKIINLYIDWLFFSEVGYEAMFTKVLSAEVFTGLIFGVVFFLFIAFN